MTIASKADPKKLIAGGSGTVRRDDEILPRTS